MISLLSEKEVKVVFANIEDLLLVNTVSHQQSILTVSNLLLDVLELTRRASKGVSTIYRQRR